MFNLPTTALYDITSNATALFHDFWIVVALMIGVPLGFWIVNLTVNEAGIARIGFEFFPAGS